MSRRARRDVVLIVSDDHAAHAVSAYGSRVTSTPRIDEIATRGVRVDRCFVTNSLCSPSRATILTGTYGHVNGVLTLSTPIDASQPTFVSALRDAGYRTAIVGKWHLGHGGSADPQGFDYWDVLIDQGEYHDPRFLSANGLRTEPGYATDVITDLALAWLDGLVGDDPWCLLVCHKAPHRPWEPDERHRGTVSRRVPLPSTFADDHRTRSAAVRRATMRIADHLGPEDLKQPVPPGLDAEAETRWKYQRFMEDYLACVASLDDNVGRVVDWLRDRDRLGDTLLVYTSDQGFFLGDHGWFDKRLMYAESLRMPLLVSCPASIPPGSVHDAIVTNCDLAQTVLDACGVAAPARMQGRSFWGDLTGPPTGRSPVPARDGMYYRYWEHDDVHHHVPAHYGYRTERYTLIYFYNDGLGLPGCGPGVDAPAWELYDLERDPEEMVNVSDDPAYAAVRAELERMLWRAQAAVGDRPHPHHPAPRGLTVPQGVGDG